MNVPEKLASGDRRLVSAVFPGLFGGFLGLTLLKFGNPPIMEKWVTPPGNALEFVVGSPWPILWGYSGLFLVVVLGALAGGWRGGPPKWILFMPVVWLAWQFAAAVLSIETQLSYPTLAHFVACCACFYLGYYSLGCQASVTGFWIGLTIGFVGVLAAGFEQHFGGLEQTRRYFYSYIYPQMTEVPPDYLKKMSSNRIFATLFYPNALAGAILLLTPAVVSFIGSARQRFTLGARVFLIGAVGLGAISCLVWSGSKGGWLLLLLLGFLGLLRVPFSRRLKLLLVCGIMFVGLAAFGWKYAGFFKKGATSVVARFDYWDAALRTAMANPLFGTGPGTFAKPYQQLKKPESEMARLVHNDYLEQASDSGWPGFLSYTAFIVAALVYAYPRTPSLRAGSAVPGAPDPVSGPVRTAQRTAPSPGSRREAAEWPEFAIWLGVLGWALQGLLEFGLYIPALAWPAFAFLGWLLSQDRSRA